MVFVDRAHLLNLRIVYKLWRGTCGSLAFGLQHVPCHRIPDQYRSSTQSWRTPVLTGARVQKLGMVLQTLHPAIQFHSHACYLTSPRERAMLLLAHSHCWHPCPETASTYRQVQAHATGAGTCNSASWRDQRVQHLPVQEPPQKNKSVGHLAQPLLAVLSTIFKSQSE